MATTSTQAVAAPRLGKRAITLIAVLVALVAGWLIYAAKYGECNRHSQYCVLMIAGTRSEIGYEWSNGPDFYISTYPAEDAH